MSTSSEELGLVPALQKAVRAEVERVMVEGASRTERVMKPDKKQAKKRAVTEQVMKRVMKPGKKRAKKRVMERVMEQVMEQVRMIKRETKRVIKRVIKQEMKHLIQTLSPQVAPTYWNVNARTPLGHQFTKSDVGEYHLLFGKKLHEIIYTKDKITDEDGGSVQIKLIVPITGGIIEEIGGLSSVEIEIVVLEGDFGSDSHENWTEKEFNDKIVPQRGHKPLVKEKQNITLRDGVGSIGDLKFSVNSRRTSCKKFRLGARILQSSSNMVQVRIKEAVSDAFTVRDQRGKMKHLEKIKEGGKFHKALIDNHICSGSELKQMYKTDPGKLMMILKGCSKWEWEVIVNHASCVLDDANSNPSRSQEAEANNTLTTGSTPFCGFQSIQQGSTGMPNNSNRASSSQCLAENLPNSASQPLDMPNPHSNTNYAPLILSNDSHQPLNNDYGDPRWYSPYLLPSNDNHMTESYQINNNGLDDTFFYST